MIGAFKERTSVLYGATAHSLCTVLSMAATPQQADIPEGVEVRQTEDGQVFYMDHKTKETSWVNPSLLGEHSDLPEGWEARFTKEGQVYYVDHKTKTSSWVNPNLLDQHTSARWMGGEANRTRKDLLCGS